MSDSIQTFRTEVRGLVAPRHVILDGQGERLGSLHVRRNRLGMVVHADYRPVQGEVLHLRRDPGLLRAQFSLWTESREWLGSSLRWSTFRRQIDVWTGGKPYRMVPTPGFGRGWRVLASKTGEVARIEAGVLSRDTTLSVHRKLDFELLVFCYFLGSLVLREAFFPTSLAALEEEPRSQPSATKA